LLRLIHRKNMKHSLLFGIALRITSKNYAEVI